MREDPVRTLIVDDEPDARARIRWILDEQPQAEIVGEAGDGLAAAELIRKLEPDLVFLDVSMPEIDGFGVLAAVSDTHLPLVVFVTAFDDHAVRAFEVHAVDYVLKPFDTERLLEAFERSLLRLRDADASAATRGLLRLMAARPSPPPAQRLLARTRTGFELIRVAELDWVEASGNYVTLHVGARTAMIRQTIGGLEKQLDPARFRRIHRSTIVNLDRVREIRPNDSGDYSVLLHDGTHLRISRGYRQGILSDLP